MPATEKRTLSQLKDTQRSIYGEKIMQTHRSVLSV